MYFFIFYFSVAFEVEVSYYRLSLFECARVDIYKNRMHVIE